jgi:hypothetical protein
MVDWMSSIFKTTSTIYNITLYVILFSFIIGIIVLIYFIKKYKHFFRVRELTGDKTRIIDDKAREIKDDTGVVKWKLLKRRHFVPVPPPEVIHLTSKGKLSVEAYYTQTGEYKYIVDNGIDNKIKSTFQPLTTEDREFYANEMRKAESYRKKSMFDMIKDALPLISLLLIFILMLVFWEDIAKPGITIVEKAGEIAKSQEETTRMLRDIIQDRQTIGDKALINSTIEEDVIY